MVTGPHSRAVVFLLVDLPPVAQPLRLPRRDAGRAKTPGGRRQTCQVINDASVFTPPPCIGTVHRVCRRTSKLDIITSVASLSPDISGLPHLLRTAILKKKKGFTTTLGPVY